VAATTLNKAAASQGEFIPQLWLSRALGFLHQNAVLAGLVNRDYEPTLQSKGDTVNVPIMPNFVANDKAADTVTTKQTGQGKTVPVTLAYHKEVTFLVEDVAQAQAQPDLLDGYTRKAALAIAKKIDYDLAGMWAQYGTGMSIGSGSTDISEDTILEGRELLNALEVPYESRFLVVKDFHDMLKVTRFTEVDKIGQTDAIRNGLIGKIHGFYCYEDPRIWTVTGSGAATHNLMFHRDGIVLATRALAIPPAGMGVQGSYLDMDGVGMRLTYSWNHDYLATQVTLDVLYGLKVIHHPTDQTIYKAPLIDLKSA
jgi:hypothetical protein